MVICFGLYQNHHDTDFFKETVAIDHCRIAKGWLEVPKARSQGRSGRMSAYSSPF
jgi:hypothetical protein